MQLNRPVVPRIPLDVVPIGQHDDHRRHADSHFVVTSGNLESGAAQVETNSVSTDVRGISLGRGSDKLSHCPTARRPTGLQASRAMSRNRSLAVVNPDRDKLS